MIWDSNTHYVFLLCIFMCYTSFLWPMVLCVVSFILYFGIGFLLVACDSCFKHDALVRVFYVILCGVWTMLVVGANKVAHDKGSPWCMCLKVTRCDRLGLRWWPWMQRKKERSWVNKFATSFQHEIWWFAL